MAKIKKLFFESLYVTSLITCMAVALCVAYDMIWGFKEYDTLCLLEKDKLVTFRGNTTKPKKDDYGNWWLQEKEPLKGFTPKRSMIGDCFFRPAD